VAAARTRGGSGPGGAARGSARARWSALVPDGVRTALAERSVSVPHAEFLRNDPVHLARRYRGREDREVAALLGALLAFGKASAFIPKVRALLDLLGPSPRRYAESYHPGRDRAFFSSFRSRIYRGDDVRLLLWNLRAVLLEHPSLEDAFLSGPAGDGPAGHLARLTAFAGLFRRLDPWPITGSHRLAPGYRHLVVDPSGGSACKRWNLFLRWVVRPDDGVDLGVWRRVDPGALVIPLDIHVGRITRLIGIRNRRTSDWKSAEEVTMRLRSIDPRDPVRFDFALSHLGISESCRGRWVREICGPCALRTICREGRRGRSRAAGGAEGTP
jgi:uncharacterized protein (TIGR02757 family)